MMLNDLGNSFKEKGVFWQVEFGMIWWQLVIQCEWQRIRSSERRAFVVGTEFWKYLFKPMSSTDIAYSGPHRERGVGASNS